VERFASRRGGWPGERTRGAQHEMSLTGPRCRPNLRQVPRLPTGPPRPRSVGDAGSPAIAARRSSRVC